MKTQVLIFLLGIALAQSAATKKKSTEEATPSPSSPEDPPPGPAILAIEIVDGNDTSTEVRNNTKRTIESALGYGFQSNYYPTSQEKKYMVYPYSQRDIPAASINDASKYLSSQTLNIQKSVSYNLGTKIEPTVQSKQLFTPTQSAVYSDQSGDGGYYPSTLFSTVGQGGILGGLSTHLPQQQVSAASTIPVIILRVYTNQLSDPSAIYPNLPQTNPYANNLNNINLQSIISNYLQQQMYQAQQMYKQPVYQSPSVGYQQGQNLVYSGQNPTYLMYSTQGSYQTQQPQIDYKSAEQSAATLPTHENYPSNSHTRVVYHGPKGHIQGVSYTGSSAATQSYGTPRQSHAPAQQYQQSYSQPQSYAPNSQYVYADSQEQNYATNTQNVYTDSQGQSYIYVDPSQLQQGQGYYQQDYQQEYQPQQEYQQQEYQQQQYQQPDYQQSYRKPQEDRKYLPVPQTNQEKVYNYHAESGKERSKKSSGGPVTFEPKKIESKRKV